MLHHKTALRLTLIILLTSISTTFAQKNYFYGAAQLPALSWIESALEDNGIQVGDPYRRENAGLIFNLGYGINLNRYFVMETGFEYYLYGPPTEYYDYSVGRTNFSDQFHINHQAISLQLRPLFKLSINEDVALRFGLGVNYQKMITNASYSIYQETETDYQLKNKYSKRIKTDFAINLQPSTGIFVKLSDRWTVGLDMTYTQVDWNNTLTYLRFKEVPNLAIQGDKTSTVFAAIKVLFR
jgi:hypothetical protein